MDFVGAPLGRARGVGGSEVEDPGGVGGCEGCWGSEVGVEEGGLVAFGRKWDGGSEDAREEEEGGKDHRGGCS